MATEAKASLVGATPDGIFGRVYSLRDLNTNPQDILFRLVGGKCVRVSCASDGESLWVDSEFPWPCDMQDDGALFLVDVSSDPVWKVIKGERIVAVNDVADKTSRRVIGFGLHMQDGKRAYLLNLGDELRIFNSLEPGALKEALEEIESR
jgi:hypothetical protein